jgi:hypothetical protein
MASGALDTLRINAHDLVGRDRKAALRTDGIEFCQDLARLEPNVPRVARHHKPISQ